MNLSGLNSRIAVLQKHWYCQTVSSLQLIEEIKRLPAEEQQKVFEFTRYAAKEQLSPEQLGDVLRKMVNATDPAEKEQLKAEFVRGFYGNEPHA